MTPGTPLKADAVAARFARSKDWLLRARPELEARGFPPPVPTPPARGRRGRGRPVYVWDQAAVEAWFALQAPAHLHAAMGLPAAANENDPRTDRSARTAATLEGRLL
jgi:hypothetical protein